jgi:uncharacterized protein (DUF58 family)
MTPSPHLLTSLMRSRLLVRQAQPSIGVGERRSRRKGPGMEFVDYRDYAPGDDTRHLDPHLHVRTGGYYVRQHAVYQQLPIAIIVDGSASMHFGTPSKFEFACGLASALAFAGLAGGDVVEVGVCTGGRLAWSPRVRGARRAPVLFSWLGAQRPAGSGFGAALATAVPRLSHRGLLILLSDWWDEHIESDVKALAAPRQEIVAVHVSSPQELDPAAFGGGDVRFVDSESGHEIELTVDRNVVLRYRTEFAAWQDRLRRLIGDQRGRYLPVSSDCNIERLLLNDWCRLGVIGW